jgi:hypothetical protein
MNKIVDGLKEAVRVATCDHELVLDGDPICDGRLNRMRCTKCTGLFWTPVSRSPQDMKHD